VIKSHIHCIYSEQVASVDHVYITISTERNCSRHQFINYRSTTTVDLCFQDLLQIKPYLLKANLWTCEADVS